MRKGRGRKINLELRTVYDSLKEGVREGFIDFGMDFKRKNEKEERKGKKRRHKGK